MFLLGFRLGVRSILVLIERRLTGEYRETIWGYTPQPITAVGTFTLQWIGTGIVASAPPTGFNNKIYLPTIRR